MVHLHSPSAAGRAFSGREWSSRLSPLDIRHQEGVSGTRGVKALIFTRHPPPGRRIRTPSGPSVDLHSPSTAGKAYWRSASCPVVYRRSLSAAGRACSDLERSKRSSLLAIHRREGVSGPRVLQSFIFTRYPPPGRRIWSPNGPAVHLLSLSAIRHQAGVCGPRVVHLHSPCAAGRAFSGREWSSRLSPLDIRHQERVSETRGV